MPHPPVKLKSRAYEHICSKLTSGSFDLQTPLSEPQLAKELGFSRTPIREAIHELESKGVLEQRPGAGTFLRQPTRRDMIEIYQIRLLVEPFAAAEACRLIEASGLMELEQTVQTMKALARDFAQQSQQPVREAMCRAHSQQDMLFHVGLLRRAGNSRLAKMLDGLHILKQALGYTKDKPDSLGATLSNVAQEHGAILAAVRRGDPRIVQTLMKRHLQEGSRRAMEYFDWQEEV